MNVTSAGFTEGLLQHARDGWLECSEQVLGMFGPQVRIDEMALLFSGERAVAACVKSIVSEEGYELFNVASDTVETSPIPSMYGVGYWFVRTPFDYRLELMHLISGFSPLHHPITMLPDNNDAIGVHASFKVASEESYAAANATLLREGWECAMKCTSTYGKFSYWTHEDHVRWFLKPRVNLRDAKGNV